MCDCLEKVLWRCAVRTLHGYEHNLADTEARPTKKNNNVSTKSLN